jgi:hypothetical protein
LAHASSHQNGGSDEVATGTPAAFGIPKADTGAELDAAWLKEMVGADSGSTGFQGAVPTPEPADRTRFLRGDGSWSPATAYGNVLSEAWTPLETTSGTYVVVGTFVWAGSDMIGVPTKIQALAGCLDAAMTMSARMYDRTNAATIAEVTGFNDLYPTIKDLGTISNVTTTQAVWELQIRRDSGTGAAKKASGSSILLTLP